MWQKSLKVIDVLFSNNKGQVVIVLVQKHKRVPAECYTCRKIAIKS